MRTGYKESVVRDYKNTKPWKGNNLECIEDIDEPLEFKSGLTANMSGTLNWSGLNHAVGTVTVEWPTLDCSAIYEAQVY